MERTREIKVYNQPTTEDMEGYMNKAIEVLNKQYGFYFCGNCSYINDLETLIRRKPDYYNHRVALYYNEEGVYFVIYAKKFIGATVLLSEDMKIKPVNFAHKMAKQLNKIIGLDKVNKNELF